jgi:hypothetical protein
MQYSNTMIGSQFYFFALSLPHLHRYPVVQLHPLFVILYYSPKTVLLMSVVYLHGLIATLRFVLSQTILASTKSICKHMKVAKLMLSNQT